MKKIKLFGGVCLAFVLVMTLSGAAFAAEEENESGRPLPPSVMPVVILQGSDYEMGYQYYQQIIEIFGPWVLEKRQREFSDDQITALKAYQWYIKEWAPEFIEMFKGMAAGATFAGVELSYKEVLARYTGTSSSYLGTEPPGSQDEDLPPQDCSGWAAWGSATTDGSLIAGDSQDGTFAYNVAIVAFPDTGNNYTTLVTETELLHHPCMNNKGLVIVKGMSNRGNVERGYGVPSSIRQLHIIRVANNADEALAMQLAYPRGTGGGLWADVGGNAYIMECKDPEAIRRPGDVGEGDFIYATNNYLAQEMYDADKRTEFIDHAGWVGSYDSAIARNLELWDMFHNYQGKVDLDFAKMMWRHPGILPDGTGEGISELKPINQLRYWGQICNSDDNRVGIMLPDDGDEGKMYACTGPAGKVNYPLGGDRSFQIAATHSFFELALASSPYRVVRAAKEAAKCSWSPTMDGGCIGNAYYELMKLNYDDPAYAPLNELFSLANAEYFEGNNWSSKASSASGNERLLYYAKAVTAYTRAQAHANQVYNALVEPATNPEDLGLKVYGDKWGEWAQPSWSFDLPGKGKAKGKNKNK